MAVKKYRIRYLMQADGPFGPLVDKFVKVMPGVRVSDTDFGYADDVVIVSILHKGEDKYASLAMFASEGLPDTCLPSRQTLLKIRDYIDHMLEHHVPE